MGLDDLTPQLVGPPVTFTNTVPNDFVDVNLSAYSVGDFAIVYLLHANDQADTHEAPDGTWTLGDRGSNDVSYSWSIWWKILTAGDLTTVTFTCNELGDNDFAASVTVIKAGTFYANSPIAASQVGVEGVSVTEISLSASAGMNNQLALFFLGNDGAAATDSWSQDSGVLTTQELDATVTGDDLVFGIFSHVTVSAGPVSGVFSCSGTSPDVWDGHLVIIARQDRTDRLRLTPADVTPGSDPFRTKVFVP